MPNSLIEHFDALWVLTTIILTGAFSIVIYFIRSWKSSVDDALEVLEDEDRKKEVNIIKTYVSKAEFKEATESLNRVLCQLEAKVDLHHEQIMYQLGLRNGVSGKAFKPKKESE